jgi:glycosyltransferase involved in cell wall biosynthesis
MTEFPRIAIVTPSFNTARYIGVAVRSVLDQAYPNLDYLVMDGGSTDGTQEILRTFGEKVRWVSQKDAGQADAIRRGFENTDGDILTWLNSDDLFCFGAFEAVASFFAAHPDVDVVYGDANYVDANGFFIARCAHVEPYSQKRLFNYSDFIVQPAAFFRRRAYEAVGGIDPQFHWALDYDLWLKMAPRFKFAYLPKVLANYRWVGNNKSAVGGSERLDEIASVFHRLGRRPPAYIQLERVNQIVRDGMNRAATGHVISAAGHAMRAAATLLASPRAMASLLSPHTWRIVWVGQVLRRRAERAASAEVAAADFASIGDSAPVGPFTEDRSGS